MTKFVTCLAILQQVEAGVLSYDDPEIVLKYAPDLCEQKLFVSYDREMKKAELKDLERTPTLRDLVTHTSGQVYGFMDPNLFAYLMDNGLGQQFGMPTEKYLQPFLFSPDQRFAYGTGVDWAGIILERATGKTLEEYFRERIFDPLGVSEATTFYNRPDVLARRQHTVNRYLDRVVPAQSSRPLNEDMGGQLSGGGGLWSTLEDYLAILRGVLRSQEPGGIIKPESFQLLFKDNLPADSPERGSWHRDLTFLLSMIDMLSPQLLTPGDLGFSIAYMVTAVDTTGRKAGSGGWGGVAATQFCIDPTTGVAFVAMTQIERAVPPGVGPPIVEPYSDCVHELEDALYKYLS